jgi:hypothetical protein
VDSRWKGYKNTKAVKTAFAVLQLRKLLSAVLCLSAGANVKNIFIVTKLFKDAICDLILVFRVLYSSFVACTVVQCMRKRRHKAPHFFVVYMATAMRRHWRYAPGVRGLRPLRLGFFFAALPLRLGVLYWIMICH